MRFTNDRCHMMLAMTNKRNMGESDHVIIPIYFSENGLQILAWINFVARKIFLKGTNHSPRSLKQPFTTSIFANPLQQVTYGVFRHLALMGFKR